MLGGVGWGLPGPRSRPDGIRSASRGRGLNSAGVRPPRFASANAGRKRPQRRGTVPSFHYAGG